MIQTLSSHSTSIIVMADSGVCQSYLHELVMEGGLLNAPALNALVEFTSVRH